MTRGRAADRWCPDVYLRTKYPSVRVYEMELPGRLQGCCDHAQQIIWIAAGLTPAARRSVLAYEVAQLRQGPTPSDACLAAAHLRDATDWAAQMLIGSEDLVDAFGRAYNYDEVAALLDVDVPTVRARLRGMTDTEQDDVFTAILSQRLTA